MNAEVDAETGGTFVGVSKFVVLRFEAGRLVLDIRGPRCEIGTPRGGMGNIEYISIVAIDVVESMVAIQKLKDDINYSDEALLCKRWVKLLGKRWLKHAMR